MSNETITLNTYTSIVIALYFVISIIVLIVVWKLRVKTESPSKQIGFTIPSVKLIKEHKGIPAIKTVSHILGYNYLCCSNPKYPPHMEGFISFDYYSADSVEIKKTKSVMTAMAAFYKNSIEDSLVQYDKLTAEVYAQLESDFTFAVYFAREKVLEQIKDLNKTTAEECATFLDALGYSEIVNHYNFYSRSKEQLPHPMHIVEKENDYNKFVAHIREEDITMHDVRNAMSAYSCLVNQPIPKIYSSPDVNAVIEILKNITVIRNNAFEIVAGNKKPKAPALQLVK